MTDSSAQGRPTTEPTPTAHDGTDTDPIGSTDGGPGSSVADALAPADTTAAVPAPDQTNETDQADQVGGSDPADTTAAVRAPDQAEETGEADESDRASGPEQAEATAEARDPWEAFAPAPERAPTRLGRIRQRFWRGLTHEWTVASVASLILAIVMTWPAVIHPTNTVAKDLPDPGLQSWQLAWGGHALRTDPVNLWHANTFHPNRYSFAFSDTLLGYAPASLIGSGMTAALVRYNVLFILACALAFLGGYALVRQLGADRVGAAVAALAFAYAPWRYSHTGHLNIISCGGIALALAMLARGHGWSLREGFRRDRVRPGWAFAGWLVAAWQVSLGFAIGVPFVYVLAGATLVALVALVLRRWRPTFRLVLADLNGIIVFGAVGALMAYPYFRLLLEYPRVRRGVGDVASFSSPPIGLLTAPEDSWLWGSAHRDLRGTLGWWPEMTLLPGFTLYGLAIAGLFFSIWSVRARLLLLFGTAATMIFALGTQGPWRGNAGYLLLYRLPGWDSMRTPGRLVMWTTLLLGILAAGAIGAFVRRGVEVRGDRVPGRRERLLRLATLVPLVLVLVEGLNTMPHPVVPRPPAALGQVPGPMLLLPSNGDDDKKYTLWSTEGFPKIVNGHSSYDPPRVQEIREATQRFPDPESVELLRSLGVRSVVVLRDHVAGTPYAGAVNPPVDLLDISREEHGEIVVYTLTP